MWKIIIYIYQLIFYQLTNIILNGRVQTRAHHQVSLLPYSVADLPSPTLLSPPETSFRTDFRSEGLLINHARQCTFFSQPPVAAID